MTMRQEDKVDRLTFLTPAGLEEGAQDGLGVDSERDLWLDNVGRGHELCEFLLLCHLLTFALGESLLLLLLLLLLLRDTSDRRLLLELLDVTLHLCGFRLVLQSERLGERERYVSTRCRERVCAWRGTHEVGLDLCGSILFLLLLGRHDVLSEVEWLWFTGTRRGVGL